MIKHKFKIIKTCRLCKSKDLSYIYKYQNSPLCDEFLQKKNKQFFYPLRLQKCNKCLFVQIDTVVEPRKIYDNYLYLSHSSSGLSDHFKKYALELIKDLRLKKLSKVIDIGSNDGVLLKHFQKKGFEVYGIEPFKEACEVANNNNIRTINSYFDEKLVNSFIKILGEVDLICINNLYANVENLNDFTKNCAKFLKIDGYLVIESSYLFSMLNRNIFDFVYHEHLSYLSVTPLKKFMKSYGLQLIKTYKNESKGGSLRYVFKKTRVSIKNYNIRKIVEDEKKLYKNFKYIMFKYEQNIINLRNNFKKFLSKYNYKTIAAFGASATSTTFLSEIKIGKKINLFIDENPAKIKTYSPGYGIKVISLDDVEKYNVDIIIILAWRFRSQIIKKIKKLKIDYLVPLPNFKIYKYKN